MSADLERVIKIVFAGDYEAGQAFGEAIDGLGQVEGAVRSVTQPMAQLADDILKVQAAAATLATGGIALAVREAGLWSDSFNEISTLLDISGADLETYKNQVKDYSATSRFSWQDVSSAIYEANSRYTEYGDSLSFVGQAEKLAIAGKSDLTAATVLLAGSMGAYGAAADEVGRYSDVFFTIVKEGGTTLPQVADSLAKLTALAAPAGVEIEQLGAMLATLTARGMPTSEAMTAVQGVLAAIIKPSEQAAKLAESLGIQFDSAGLAAKGFDGFLKDVYARTNGNNEQLAKLFGNVTGLAAVLSAFGPDGGDLFLSNLEKMRNAAGATETAWARMKDNFGLVTQQLVNAIRFTLIDAGLPLLEQFGAGVGVLTQTFLNLRLGVSSGAFDPLYDAFDGLMDRLIEYGKGVSSALPEALKQIDYKPLLEGLENLGDAISKLFRALFQDIDLTTPEGLSRVLQTLVNTLGNLANTSAGILKEWEPLFRVAGDLVQRFADLDGSSAELAGSFLGAAQKAEMLWDKFGFLKGTMLLLAGESAGLGEKTSILGQALNAVLGPTGLVKGAMEEAGAAQIRAAKNTEESAQQTDFLKLSVNALLNPLGSAVAWLLDFGSGAVEAADNANALENAAEDLTAAIEQIPEEKRVAIVHEGWDTFMRDLENTGDAILRLPELAEVELRMKSHDNPDVWIKEWSDYLKDQVVAWEMKVGADTAPAKEAVEELTKEEKKIRLELDTARIKADSEIIRETIKADAEIAKASLANVGKAIEWKAKLDIAEVEANARRVEAIMSGVQSAFESTGEVLSSIFGADSETIKRLEWVLGSSGLKEFIQEQVDLQKEAMEIQKELAKAEIAYMEAKTKSLERGDAQITIDGAGLQPHLEAFMWEILSAIQIRVNEEGMDMLLGSP